MVEGGRDILVSVCMVTYNHEKYVAEAIEGVLMQKCDFPMELIIGEDCSTDDTRAICMEYQSRYPDKIRLITSDHNVGMIKNFVRVIRKARGRYIAFCDGDDYWTESLKLQRQLDFLEQNQEYGLCYSNISIYNQTKGEYEQDNVIDKRNITNFEQLLLGNYIPTLSVCCRKRYVDDFLDMYSDLYWNWVLLDYPIWLYVSFHSGIKFFSEKMGVYRLLGSSASHFYDKDKLFDFARKTVEILLIMNERSSFKINRINDVDYEYMFLKQYYSWFIAMGNMKYTISALSYFMRNKYYKTFFWGLVHLPFWKYARLPFRIADLKSIR